MAIHFDDDDFYEFLNFGDGQYSDDSILVEGDSWAAHPQLFNLAHRLDIEEKGDCAVLSLAHSGDTAKNMFEKKSKQFRRFKRVVKSKEFGFKFSMILLSAGGNDIIGPEIKNFLHSKRDNPTKHGKDLINHKKFDPALRDINKNFSNILNVISKSTMNNETPIVAHTYSYLQPRRVGTHLGPITFSEGWVAKHMEEDKFITDPQEQADIIKAMLGQFASSLATLENDFGNFLVVDTLNVLTKNKKPDISLFHDEIHPNRIGFKKVLGRVKSVAKKKGFWVA